MFKVKSNLLIIEKLNYYAYLLILINYFRFSSIYIFDEYQLISSKHNKKKYIFGKKVIIGMGAGSISNWIKELPTLL